MDNFHSLRLCIFQKWKLQLTAEKLEKSCASLLIWDSFPEESLRAANQVSPEPQLVQEIKYFCACTVGNANSGIFSFSPQTLQPRRWSTSFCGG